MLHKLVENIHIRNIQYPNITTGQCEKQFIVLNVHKTNIITVLLLSVLLLYKLNFKQLIISNDTLIYNDVITYINSHILVSCQELAKNIYFLNSFNEQLLIGNKIKIPSVDLEVAPSPLCGTLVLKRHPHPCMAVLEHLVQVPDALLALVLHLLLHVRHGRLQVLHLVLVQLSQVVDLRHSKAMIVQAKNTSRRYTSRCCNEIRLESYQGNQRSRVALLKVPNVK